MNFLLALFLAIPALGLEISSTGGVNGSAITPASVTASTVSASVLAGAVSTFGAAGGSTTVRGNLTVSTGTVSIVGTTASLLVGDNVSAGSVSVIGTTTVNNLGVLGPATFGTPANSTATFHGHIGGNATKGGLGVDGSFTLAGGSLTLTSGTADIGGISIVRGANPSHAASRSLMAYSPGTSQWWSYGADVTTAGTFNFSQRSSDGSVGGTVMAIDSTGNLTVGGNAVFGSSVTTGQVVVANGASVGIGTASPGTKLHMSSGTLTVDGTAAKIALGDGTNAGTLVLVGSGTSSGNFIRVVNPAETIAAAAVITADGCGGQKVVTAGGAVTTNTTDTITAPAAANAGCCMMLYNSGATNTITLDQNAHNNLAADTGLGPCDSVQACSDGSRWAFGAVFAGTCN